MHAVRRARGSSTRRRRRCTARRRRTRSEESSPCTPSRRTARRRSWASGWPRDCGVAWGLSWVGAALLQRGRRRPRRARRQQRQQPDPHGLPRPRRGPAAAGVRRRLPDAGRHLHPRLHPRRRTSPSRTSRRRPAARRGRRPTCSTSAAASGSSVREVMDAVSATCSAATSAPEVVGRRAGDPPATFASTERIAAELGWRARRDLADMVDVRLVRLAGHPAPRQACSGPLARWTCTAARSASGMTRKTGISRPAFCSYCR